MRDTDLLQLALEVDDSAVSIPPLSEVFKHLPGVFTGGGILALAGCLSKKLISWFSPLASRMKTEKTFTLTLAIVLLGALSGTAVAAGGGGVLTDPGAMQGKHFDPQGKMPSKFTIAQRPEGNAAL